VYYRDPDSRIGVGGEAGTAPFPNGEAFLEADGDEEIGVDLLE
jgi:hypothetical protein